MSFTLLDMSSENFEFFANVWHWKAGVEIIRSLDVLSEGVLKQMAYNATGVKVSRDDAHEIGSRIRSETLPKVPAGSRIFADMSITNAPDDMTLHRDHDDQWKNYSVDSEWLAEFSDFCLRSKGFQVF